MNGQDCELMLHYLNGTLTTSGLAELNHRLVTDPAFCRAAARLWIQEAQLREIARERAGRWMDSAPACVDDPSPVRPFPSRLRVPRHPLPWALAASLAVGLSGFLLLRGPARFGPPQVTAVEGSVLIERQTDRRAAVAGAVLLPGDRLLVAPEASAQLGFQGERTWIRFSGGADARIEAGGPAKAVTLVTGSLSAMVAPQSPQSPMLLATPHARATVLGTQLRLSADTERTRLEVWEGKVRLTRTADGTSTEVESDQVAVTGQTLPLSRTGIRHGVLREYWLNVRSQGPPELADVSCLETKPSGRQYLASFEAPHNYGDSFVARFRAFLRPPVSGQYQFWIAGDDRAELWLSRSELAVHKVRICSAGSWTGPLDWDRNPSQQSALIWLEAGRTYYVEALHQEGGGADSASVAWAIPGKQREVLSGRYLIPPLDIDGEDTQSGASLE